MHSTTGAVLSATDEEVLARAKEANGPWFVALLKAAKIQADRRAKYSGDGDPYTNFYKTSELMEINVDKIFEFYQAIKLARIEVAAGNFDDERIEDTLIDLANYCLLEAGFRCRNSTSNAQAQSSQMKFPFPTA